jgi:hypothetical protein
MNHFLSGIIKIVLIEAVLATLLLQRLTSSQHRRAMAVALTALAGLGVFAWCDFGRLRHDTDVGFVVALAPLLVFSNWMLKAAFDPEHSTFRQKAFAVHCERRLGSLPLLSGRATSFTAVTLSSVLCLGFVAMGHLQSNITLVHPWEQFHFYMGAKYQREVGWFDLYKAALAADRESVNRLSSVTHIRAIETFEETSVDALKDDIARVKTKFSQERFESFRRDWITLTNTWPINWADVLKDHGNSNSPAWSLVAAPLVSLVPLGKSSQSWLGWIDMLLMVALWLTIFRCFETSNAATGLFFWAVPPLVFPYLSGSLLRFDWLFAVGIAACCLQKNKWATAGAFFGYAVATKIFPLFFGVAMLVPAWNAWRDTRALDRKYVRFAGAALATGVILFAASCFAFGTSAWAEYAARIQVAQLEKFYAIQYSLKTVFLQIVESGASVWLSNPLFPAQLMQSLPQVDIANHPVSFFVVRLAFTACIALLLRRVSPVEAFLFGPALVFVWLTVNMYYWNMLGLFALGLSLRKDSRSFGLLLGLGFSFMFFYWYQHTNRGLFEGYAVATVFAVGLLSAGAFEAKAMFQGQSPRAKADTVTG